MLFVEPRLAGMRGQGEDQPELYKRMINCKRAKAGAPFRSRLQTALWMCFDQSCRLNGRFCFDRSALSAGADRDAARLHAFRQLAHQIDVQ
jgi:hypothetical protein